MGRLPELSKDIIGKRFRRADWSDGYAFTTKGSAWRYTSSHAGNTFLAHINHMAEDWYEVDEFDIQVSEYGLKIKNEEEERHMDATRNEEEAIKNEVAKVFTDLERRTKYTGELYGPDGKGRGILAFNKKSDAKKLLAVPSNLGCYIVLRKEVAVYTTVVPVIKAGV